MLSDATGISSRARRHGLADVLGLEQRELLGVRVERVRQLEQRLGAFAGCRLEPLGQRRLGSVDRPVDVGLVPFGTSAIVSPVDGLMISAVPPSAASTHLPPTKFWNVEVVTLISALRLVAS